MTEKEYRSSDGVSRSELWRIRESPEKFKYYREHPEPPTPALLFGQVAHKLILEPETFDNDFAVAPDCNRRTKEGKALYGAFCDGLGDREAIPPADYQKAVEMAQACRASPFVGKLLDGEHEKPVYWTDDLTGELCKIRLDCLSKVGDNLVIVDYKTTSDASNDGFMRHAVSFGYPFQCSMYLEGVCQSLYKKSILDVVGTPQSPLFVFIAQEKKEPYSVNIFQSDDIFVRYGYDVFRELIGLYHDCKISNNFFGYLGKYNVINNLSLPSYLAKEIE